jgi:hypothetical protein
LGRAVGAPPRPLKKRVRKNFPQLRDPRKFLVKHVLLRTRPIALCNNLLIWLTNLLARLSFWVRNYRQAYAGGTMKNESLPVRHWRRRELAELWRISERTLDRLRESGVLDEPLVVGARSLIWSDAQRRAAERRMHQKA